ncbi:hypothetical protein OsJ_12403 [Oryza sativa Japonica Group]|uniref:Uncharacterized protein n=1 Tax=Oryza sativa subsp. japonica TaxID=39947 RepID=A3AM83_ORYSJ|nr:hypothetical protein OsJ_12403 [Oryza sativa Japonica Group]
MSPPRSKSRTWLRLVAAQAWQARAPSRRPRRTAWRTPWAPLGRAGLHLLALARLPVGGLHIGEVIGCCRTCRRQTFETPSRSSFPEMVDNLENGRRRCARGGAQEGMPPEMTNVRVSCMQSTAAGMRQCHWKWNTTLLLLLLVPLQL